MADPSLVSSDYRYINPNDSAIRPNLWRDPFNETSMADEADLTATAARLLLESLSAFVIAATTTVSSWNSSENGTELAATTASVWDSCDTENPSFNCSVLEFLEYHQGPQMMPFFKAIMVSSLQCPMCLDMTVVVPVAGAQVP